MMLKNPMNACGRYPDVRMDRQQESCRRRTATGGNYEETGMGLVNYSGAGGGARALLVAIGQVYVTGCGWDPA